MSKLSRNCVTGFQLQLAHSQLQLQLHTHTQLYSPFKAAQLYIEHTHIHAHTQMKLN